MNYELITANFSTSGKQAISGHSMGGHGAITLALKNPSKYVSCSAFAPIVNPINCPWGQKAFSAYLGDNKEAWKAWDSCELLAANQHEPFPLLIEQGLGDNFFENQRLTTPLIEACEKAGFPLMVNQHQDYDHSYFFISTFIEEHLRFHYQYLQ